MENLHQEKGTSSTIGSSQYTDPTYNVLQLVNASVVRLNDLASKNEQILDLHISYMKELSLAESKRIDAIRAVDVGAVAIASERAAAQATVLANQVAQSAETLRTLVATTASTAASQFQNVTALIMDRVSVLEKSQYEIRGKGQGGKDIIYYILAVIMVLGFAFNYFAIKGK